MFFFSFFLFFPVCSRAEMVRRAVRNSWVGFYPSGRREPCMRITCSISSRKSCVSSTSQNLYRLVSSAYHSIVASVLCALRFKLDKHSYIIYLHYFANVCFISKHAANQACGFKVAKDVQYIKHTPSNWTLNCYVLRLFLSFYKS